MSAGVFDISATACHIGHMDKAEHGRRLKTAMASRGFDRTVIADAVGVRVRTVTNWTSGKTMPPPAHHQALRRLLGPYDDDGDAVEVALATSELSGWRQDAVRSVYRKHLDEQHSEAI